MKTQIVRTPSYRRFYALLRTMPGANKEDMVAQFTNGRTESLQAMRPLEFSAMLACMEGQQLETKYGELDKLRKRVIAAIGAYLRATNRPENIDEIKAIAARAAKNSFNDIPECDLRGIYNEFTRQVKAMKNVRLVTTADMQKLAQSN